MCVCVAGSEEQVVEALKIVVFWTVIQSRSSLAECPCRELCGAASEGGQKGSPVSSGDHGPAFVWRSGSQQGTDAFSRARPPSLQIPLAVSAACFVFLTSKATLASRSGSSEQTAAVTSPCLCFRAEAGDWGC